MTPPGMGSAGEVYVDVLPWMKDFDQKLKKGIGSSVDKVARRMQTTGKSLSKFVSLPLLAGAAASVKLASDANETENKIRVIFGKMADSVLKWSTTSIEKMGLARTTAQDMAAQLAAVFQAAKLPGPAVADMSQKFTELAADMSSFFNVPAGDALNALRSGLVGEAEPLRRFGVLLSEAAIKTEAVRIGIAKTGEELTEQQKVQARASLIMRSLNKASGDYARTADGVANKTRATAEMAKELGARFGQMLLPIMQRVLGIGQKFLGWLDSLSPSGRKTMMMILGIVAVAGPMLYIFAKMIRAIQFTAAAFRALNLAFMANPWVLLAIAVIAIAVLIFKNWDKIKAFLLKTWNTIKAVAVRVFNAIRGFLKTWGTAIAILLTGGLALLVIAVVRNWNKIKAVTMAIFNAIRAVVAAVWRRIHSAIATPLNLIRGVVTRVLGVIKAVWNAAWSSMASMARSIWGGIVGAVKAGINLVIMAINGLIRGYNLIPFHKDIPTIPHLQRGTRSFRGGLAMVGEQGRELVHLPRGSRVTSNRELEAVGAGSRGGDRYYNANFSGLVREPVSEDDVVKVLRYMELLYG